MSDPVNRPAHYTQNGIECIEAIRASMTPENSRGYLKGTNADEVYVALSAQRAIPRRT